MAELNWKNPNSLKLVVRIIGIEIIKDGLELGKDYFAVVWEGNRSDSRRIDILPKNRFQENIYQYHFNVEIKDDKYDFDKQFEIVWHETQTPYRSYRTDFQVGDTIVFDSHKNYITSCLGSGLSEDQMNDNTYYKNYRAFDEPKLIITKVEKNFENTQKTRLLVKNPNATDQTVFRIMWEFDCWGGKYELLPAGSTDEEDTPPPIIHPRKTNRFGGKRKSRRTRQKNTHRRSRKR